MKTIQQRWEELAAGIFKPGTSELQKREMRRTFFAGYYACLHAGIEMADESKDNDDIGATMIERQWQECRAFIADVQTGKA